ncbi:TetR/AcrR family transcriptional regulator [bacterium]|nr:TetR/AcrR family transcriptional regulator [bacterium]
MARRLDRRVQRTRKLLQDALMSLILEEGYDAISIQDITDEANLGRATFYLHFKDKDELLLEVMAQFIDDFMGQVPQLSEAQWHLEDTKAVIKLFDFAAQHYDLYRILIIGSGGITANRQLQHSVAKNITACIEKDIEEAGAEPTVPTDFIANHFAGSLLSTIYWWLDNDQPYSVEEMAEMFQKVSLLDRKALMGLDKSQAEPEKEDKNKKKKRSKDKSQPKKAKNETEAAAEEPQEETPDAAPEEPDEE